MTVATTAGLGNSPQLAEGGRSEPTTQVIVAWTSEGAMDPQVQRVDISIEVANGRRGARRRARARPRHRLPRTDEPWGIRRFFVREPSGTVVNVATQIADLD